MKFATMILLLAAVGCQIAPYDAATDAALTGIQRKIDGHVAALGTPLATPVYADVQTDLHLLETRTAARMAGDPSVAAELSAIKELSPMVSDMAKLESMGPAPMGVAQQQFDTAIGAILALELRRKQ